MAAFYSVDKIQLEDYDGHKQECPVALILPLYQRTESRPPKMVEDKWLEWCNQAYQHTWVKIKLVIKYL